MLNIGGGEVVVILLVALIVLGPAKLPEAVRQVGRAIGELKRMSAGFRAELDAAMEDPIEAAARDRGAAEVARRRAEQEARPARLEPPPTEATAEPPDGVTPTETVVDPSSPSPGRSAQATAPDLEPPAEPGTPLAGESPAATAPTESNPSAVDGDEPA